MKLHNQILSLQIFKVTLLTFILNIYIQNNFKK